MEEPKMEEPKMAENKMAENKMAENKKRRLETKRRLANNKFVILPVSTTYTQPEGCKYVRRGTIGKDFYMYEEYY